jgi:hypothetical protein
MTEVLEPFRWKNCRADVATARHGITLDLYLRDIIEPTLRALEAKSLSLGQSEDTIDQFAQLDVDAVLHEARMAFGLSVQSIWERQFRSYVRGCAEELRPGTRLAVHAETASWERLLVLFFDLRGIRVESFPSFATLHTLHLVGNVCRHGDGPSARELWYGQRDLWRSEPEFDSFLFDSTEKTLEAEERPSTSDMLEISLDHLRTFVSAIVEFWSDMEYIYNESIEGKHPSLEERLKRERVERRWIPRAASPNGG